ncbi:EAL domain-containing protein (putative c-di-GMP-specific phosphodiesterase class I) [Aeromonas caviae]|nr:EAL domain-containing protein (putative c-di-GMP-specific phosphodiesterase class I) [Aeromonas caviae]
MPTDTVAQRLRLAIMLGLLLLVGLTALNLLQAASGLRKDNARSLNHARAMIESAINDSAALALAARPLASHACRSNLLAMQDLIAASPYARAIYVLEGGQLLCTTLHRPLTMWDLPEYQFNEQDLILSEHSPITGQIAIFYREKVGKRTLLIELDGFHIFGTLQAVMGEDNLFFILGSQAFNSHGTPRIAASLLVDETQLQHINPSEYPYQLVALNGYKEVWAFAWHYSRNNMMAAPVLALLLGLFAFCLSGRIGSPRRELARAMAAREFIPHLQPVMDNQLRLRGCEVLMRWHHPDQGLIAPDQFIPLAEECGYIVPMTRQLMAQTRDYLLEVADRLPPGFHVAVNVCAQHFKNQDIVAECRDFLRAFPSQDLRLVLEVTEREMVDADEQTRAIFDALDELGVLIAIDDFGIGHSSLSYLQMFHVDIIKIDRSFIAGIQKEGPSRQIVENILDLAHRMGIALVAEGVETQEQVQRVRHYGIDYLQGFYFAKPLPPAQFSLHLAEAAHLEERRAQRETRLIL